MATGLITNPSGAYATTSDFRTGKDDASNPHQLGTFEQYTLRANAACALGDALMFVAPTATVPLSVTPMTAVGDDELFAGIATNAAAAAGYVTIVRTGFVRVHFDSASTAAAGSVVVVPATTTGEVDIAAGPATATSTIGVCLGPEDGTSDFALAYIGWVPTVHTA